MPQQLCPEREHAILDAPQAKASVPERRKSPTDVEAPRRRKSAPKLATGQPFRTVWSKMTQLRKKRETKEVGPNILAENSSLRKENDVIGEVKVRMTARRKLFPKQ